MLKLYNFSVLTCNIIIQILIAKYRIADVLEYSLMAHTLRSRNYSTRVLHTFSCTLQRTKKESSVFFVFPLIMCINSEQSANSATNQTNIYFLLTERS